MNESCEQGNKIMLEFQKQQNEDRLNHQEGINKLVTQVALQTQATETLVETTIAELKACKEERSFISRRINKIWVTGVVFLLGIVTTFIGVLGNFFKGHNGH